MWRRTDRHTDTHAQTAVTNIHYASATPHAKCKKKMKLEYVSFGQGCSLLWTHTLRPFYSRPIALTQEGRSLVNDVYTGRARFMLMRSDISQHWHVIGGISRISGLWSPCPKSEYPFTHVYLLNVTAEYEYTCFSVIFRNFWRGMVLRSLQRTPACHCVTASAISRKVISSLIGHTRLNHWHFSVLMYTCSCNPPWAVMQRIH